ncbi:MAG: hypothetical protein P4L40_02055, partial [Terracidiphilus sp.]|nr:hypothetical protein [Terracidiphilus sp.]
AGWVLTPLVQAQIEAKAKAAGISVAAAAEALLAEKQPSKTFATPEQIGELAAFLSTKHAAQITGALLLWGRVCICAFSMCLSVCKYGGE